jgi:DNA polymerase-3 subunit epsilon
MYAILDIETTGGKYNEEGITEIAIYRFDGHDVTDKFVSLINPEREIQPFVVNLTGINQKMLRTAPKFYEVAKRIVEITKDAIIVAHNAQFDYRILRTEFRRLGYEFERKSLCTVALSQKLIPEAESHSLGKLARSLGIAVSDRHRADGDALATLKLFKILLNQDIEKTITQKFVREGSQGELSDRQLQMVQMLPEETGIYYMMNKEGQIVYLKSAKNIKKSVNDHFTKTNKIDRILQKETKKVSFELTGSFLVGQLKERQERFKLKPAYSRYIKTQRFTHGLVSLTNGAYEIEKFSIKNTYFTASTTLNEAQKLQENLGESTEIEHHHSLFNKNVSVIDKGRHAGERSVIWVHEGHVKGYGFVELEHQINNIHILESLVSPINGDLVARYILENYLRKNRVLKIVPLNSEN